MKKCTGLHRVITWSLWKSLFHDKLRSECYIEYLFLLHKVKRFMYKLNIGNDFLISGEWYR